MLCLDPHKFLMLWTMKIQIQQTHEVGEQFCEDMDTATADPRSAFSMWTILLQVISYLSTLTYLVLSSA